MTGGKGRSSSAMGFGLSVLCACGPLVATDGTDGDERDDDTAPTSGDGESGEQESSSISITITASATTPTSDSPSTVGTTDDDPTDAGSESSTGAPALTCDEILLESTVCLTFDQSDVILAGMDSGATCLWASLPQSLWPSSIAWEADDELVVCSDSTQRITDIDLGDAIFDPTTLPCDGLAYHPQGILVQHPFPGTPLRLYTSFEGILAGDEIAEFAIDPMGSRLAVSGDLLYGAWHADDSVEVWNLATATFEGDLQLEGGEISIRGISVAGEVLYVLTSEDLILGFDVVTGARIVEYASPGLIAPQGLACR